MKQSIRRKNNEGFSLLELTIAVFILALVMGATAQALISYFAALDLQEQRNQATLTCKSVLSIARQVRDANPDDFPGAVTARFPHNEEVDGMGSLPGEVVTVTYLDPEANPLEIVVTSTWRDRMGRQISSRMGTVLADR